MHFLTNPSGTQSVLHGFAGRTDGDNSVAAPSRSAMDAARYRCNTVGRTCASGTRCGARRRNTCQGRAVVALVFLRRADYPGNFRNPRSSRNAGITLPPAVHNATSLNIPLRAGIGEAPCGRQNRKRKAENPVPTTASGNPGQYTNQTPRQITAGLRSHPHRGARADASAGFCAPQNLLHSCRSKLDQNRPKQTKRVISRSEGLSATH